LRPAHEIWVRFEAAQTALDLALGMLDAAAILEAAADLHCAAADLARPGASDDGRAVADALQAALKRIETCRLRVMFLADHGARRVAALTPGTVAADRWRPDRAA
jgi:hypothetical protein